MVRFRPNFTMDGKTLVVVVGADGQIMPRPMRADIESEIRFRLKSEIDDNIGVDMRWLEEMTEDEIEILGRRSQYAIKTIINIPPDTIFTDEMNLEFIKDDLVQKLRGFSIPITEWTSFVV